MTTGTSTAHTVVLSELQFGPARGYPGEPMDITPTSTGPLDITPTANRRGLGAQAP